jgi:hypothetical protein
MSNRNTSEKRESFRTVDVRWLASQRTFAIRHCEERLRTQYTLAEFSIPFAVNERVRSQTKLRSNLSSLINNREFFTLFRKTASQRTQSREIASWIQQRLALLMLNILLTETRNDEVWCKRRESRLLHQNLETNQVYLGLGNIL